MSRSSALFTVGMLTVVGLLGCGPADPSNDGPVQNDGRPDEQAAPAATSSAAGLSLTDADLEGYARGIRRETEAVREAERRAAAASTPEERGAATQAGFETATIPLGAEAAGVPVERYAEVREAIHTVFETLDFQDKIDGPLAMDVSRASEDMKRRLAADAFEGLPPDAASLLRARMSQLVPLWIEYVQLTAVAG